MNDPVKMREHFTAMQSVARHFLEDHNPNKEERDKAFIEQMLHMLDGPEQREAFPNEPTMQERVNAASGDSLPHPDGGAARPDARR